MSCLRALTSYKSGPYFLSLFQEFYHTTLDKSLFTGFLSSELYKSGRPIVCHAYKAPTLYKSGPFSSSIIFISCHISQIIFNPTTFLCTCTLFVLRPLLCTSRGLFTYFTLALNGYMLCSFIFPLYPPDQAAILTGPLHDPSYNCGTVVHPPSL